jgi:uncharacterized protein Yka (UPF0111/DUF47 family)
LKPLGEVYELFARAGQNAVEIARLVERRFQEWPAGPIGQELVKELEHEGDRICSRILSSIDSHVVAPVSRQHLVTLAFAVDEVPDKIESASELLGLYAVEAPTRQSLELCGLVVRATSELAALLGDLGNAPGFAPEIRAIQEIEDEADDVARAARAGLFKDDRIDPVLVIRWKGIYEALEEAVDACDTAAVRAGNLLVKNA